MVLQRFVILFAMVSAVYAIPAPEIEKRIDALLARMTLEEKLGQMSQSTSMQAPLSEEIKQQIRRGRWGSFLNAGLPPDRAEAQRIAVKESRLGIPLLFGRDVIHWVPYRFSDSAWTGRHLESSTHRTCCCNRR
jgi:beta-glucosidase